jgi:hypothetical protein
MDALRHGSTMPVNNRRTLTQAQVDEIRSLEGKMQKIDIAEKFGISPSKVWAICANKLYRNDRKLIHWTEAEERKLREAIERGLSASKISSVVGRPLSAVRSHMASRGLHLKSGHHACKRL